jgi:DNA-binding NarL/FixJ family response regulator
MPNVKVVVVDDHDVLRVGVRDFVSSLPGYEVVGEADSARAAFRMIEATKPDVVLMDIALPGMDGIVATREILRRAPRARIVVLSAHRQAHDVMDAIAAGAVGYVLKADPPETLVQALERAVRGECYVAPVLKGSVSAVRPPGKTGDVLDILSEREREIFRLAADCRTSPEISQELCIARKTVDTHLNRINRKLGLRDRAELVRLAVGIGLVHSIRRRATSRTNGAGARA